MVGDVRCCVICDCRRQDDKWSQFTDACVRRKGVRSFKVLVVVGVCRKAWGSCAGARVIKREQRQDETVE